MENVANFIVFGRKTIRIRFGNIDYDSRENRVTFHNAIHFLINIDSTHLINCPTYMLAVFECHLVRYRWIETLFVMDFPLIPGRANERVFQFHRGELASNCCSTEVLCN